MVASLNRGTPARDFMDGVVHAISREVNFDTPGIAAGVLLGSIPAGARLIGAQVHVATAFNAATTNVLTVGTLGDSGIDNILDATAVAETAGYQFVQPIAAFAQVTVDTEIRVAYNQTGTAATTGKAHVSLLYLPPNEPSS